MSLFNNSETIVRAIKSTSGFIPPNFHQLLPNEFGKDGVPLFGFHFYAAFLLPGHYTRMQATILLKEIVFSNEIINFLGKPYILKRK